MEAGPPAAPVLPAPTAQVQEALDHVWAFDRLFDAHVRAADPRFRESARNLLHYLALRGLDVREVQEELVRLGLSSLRHAGAHVLPSLLAVLRALHALSGHAAPAARAADAHEARGLREAHAEALLGRALPGRSARIMVTLDRGAAADYALVRDLLVAGVDAVRINCAHDDAAVWGRMVGHVERARRETGRPCRILMDLAGPKARTGALPPRPRALRYRPRTDRQGRVVAPARVRLVPLGPGGAGPGGAGEPGDDLALPVEGGWLAEVRPGDRIRFRDARGKKRALHVAACAPSGCWAEASHAARVEAGTVLTLVPRGSGREPLSTCVGPLPPAASFLLLAPGDTVVLSRDQGPGRPAVRDERGRLELPARIACTPPDVLADVRVGESVRFDDGKIEGVIRSVSGDGVHVEVTRAKEKGSKLRADRSINFPGSALRPRGITAKDLADLDFVARHADVVGLSFAQAPEDVVALQGELARRGGRGLGILLKVETERGFRELPWLLLAGMRRHPMGVMIARGDLAAEVGWTRLAGVQEAVLELCGAAHVPVVWATQVLEGVTKKGLPSRAEVTDAAAAGRAASVMLNKGPHLLEAVRMLDDILRRTPSPPWAGAPWAGAPSQNGPTPHERAASGARWRFSP